MSEKYKKNIEKLSDMVNDNHQGKIQVGHIPENVHEGRKVGDKWTDSDGNEWEQKDGYRTKITHVKRGIADQCSDCETLILKPWDKDSYKWNKRCYYCQIDFEAQYPRKIIGHKESILREYSGEDGAKKWNKLSKKKKQKIMDKALDPRDKYVIERLETYFKGLKEDQNIFEEETKEGNKKIFDKSVANALANAEIDTTNVKLSNNTK